MRERLSSYVDVQLPEAERAALEAHLTGCAACRAELASLTQMLRVLRTVKAPAAPDLVPGVRERLAKRPWWQRLPVTRPRMSLSFQPMHGLALVATAVLVVVVVGLPRFVHRGVPTFHAFERGQEWEDREGAKDSKPLADDQRRPEKSAERQLAMTHEKASTADAVTMNGRIASMKDAVFAGRGAIGKASVYDKSGAAEAYDADRWRRIEAPAVERAGKVMSGTINEFSVQSQQVDLAASGPASVETKQNPDIRSLGASRPFPLADGFSYERDNKEARAGQENDERLRANQPSLPVQWRVADIQDAVLQVIDWVQTRGGTVHGVDGRHLRIELPSPHVAAFMQAFSDPSDMQNAELVLHAADSALVFAPTDRVTIFLELTISQ